ncbi:hypothetical protein [Shouchella clausii]|uniref:hypothetical protein n=1 Tax=Shouchella clausii TaxID=79880 RepID=UPI0032EB1791
MVKISTSDQGIIKVVDGSPNNYLTDGAEKATIIFTGGNKLLDLNAPIVPWKGMGNIELYSHLKDFYEYINKSRPKILTV